MSVERDLVGCEVKLDVSGLMVEGWVVEVSSMFVRMGGNADLTSRSVAIPQNKITDVQVLKRPNPKDTYPEGTVVRFRVGTSYGAAVKTNTSQWRWGRYDGQLTTWARLLEQRPLTILTESTIVE